MFQYKVDQDISLRLMSELDADELFILIDESRDHLREWLPWLDDTQYVGDSRKFIQDSLLLFNNREGLTTGIFYKGELVGVGGFNEYDWKNKIGYIGYWLGGRYQGKGIMTKFVKAITDYGFNNLGLNRLDIRAGSHNVKSRAIPERLGYSLEGYMREAEWLYDHYIDHAVYSLLAREWQLLKNK